MHNQPETLGSILKAAREKAGITIEALAEGAGITERYLYRIENEWQYSHIISPPFSAPTAPWK